MISKTLIILLSSILILSLINHNPINAQEFKIELKSLNIENNKLIITYDFNKNLKGKSFDIWIEINTESGKPISARKLTGDIGDKIIAGLDKKIIWDFVADEAILDEEINVEIKAVPTGGFSTNKKAISNKQAFLRSVVFPGWGLAGKKSKNSFLVLGVSSYLLLGSSIILNRTAANTYDDYKIEYDIKTSKDKLDKSKRLDKLSKTTAYTAMGIWGVNLLWTAISNSKSNNSKDLTHNSLRKVNIYSFHDIPNKTNGITLSISF